MRIRLAPERDTAGYLRAKLTDIEGEVLEVEPSRRRRPIMAPTMVAPPARRISEATMSSTPSAGSSRRAFLAAATGAAAATAAIALDGPATVLAGVDGDVVLGSANSATATTSIGITANASDVIAATGVSENAVIVGTNGDLGSGVKGVATTGSGVLGVAPNGIGVEGSSQHGTAILGASEEGTGVFGHITLQGDAVHGHSFASKGVGVRATAEAGLALVVDGKATFSRSGRATIPTGASHVDVDLRASDGLAGLPMVFANLYTHRPGIHVEAVRPNQPSVGKLRIYLNRAVPGPTLVVWLVLG